MLNTEQCDSFVETSLRHSNGAGPDQAARIRDLLEEIELADQVGLDVFSSEDPVRAFRQFAALNLISQGRAEIIVVVAHSSSTIPTLDLISKAASKSTSRLTEYRPRLLSPNFASWCP